MIIKKETANSVVKSVIALFEGTSAEVAFGRVIVRGGKIAAIFEYKEVPMMVLEFDPLNLTDFLFGALEEAKPLMTVSQ